MFPLLCWRATRAWSPAKKTEWRPCSRERAISSHFDIGLGFYRACQLRQVSNSISGRLLDSISGLNRCILFGKLKYGNTRGSHVGVLTPVSGPNLGNSSGFFNLSVNLRFAVTGIGTTFSSLTLD